MSKTIKDLEDKNNHNIHIEEFLEYYCKLKKSPEYAVLLKGKWGCGKTWFIKKLMSELENKNKENKAKNNKAKNNKAKNNKKSKGKKMFLYVSLYGISSTEEISDEFFKQLHPVLSSKGMALAGKIGKGLLKASLKIDLNGDGKTDCSVSGTIPEIKVPDYLTNTEKYILVFDDLERCSMDLNNVLGYINHFVEHQGYKVVILANEEEILKKDKKESDLSEYEIFYKRIKEKLIGKTFEIETELDNAIKYFIKEIPNDEVKEFCFNYIDTIKDLYLKSKYDNLRHLKQTLWDFERFYKILSNKIKNKTELTLHLLKCFLRYSFEIKSGSLLATNIPELETALAKRFCNKDKNQEDIYDKILEKYNKDDFILIALTEDIWIEILDKGILNLKKIEESLLNSRYFLEENKEDWVHLWHYLDLTEDDFEFYLKEVEKKFKNMEYKEIGVIKHIVGLLLRFADIGIYSKNKNDILEFSKQYIDKLKQAKKLQTVSQNIQRPLPFNDFHNGLQVCGKDILEFEEFYKYLYQKEDEVIEESKSKQPEKLLLLMNEDVDGFYRVLTGHAFYKIPILKNIVPKKFVDNFMLLKPNGRRTACYALHSRYETLGFVDKLLPELDFLVAIKELLKKEQEAFNGKITGHQLEILIESVIDGAIETLKKNGGYND